MKREVNQTLRTKFIRYFKKQIRFTPHMSYENLVKPNCIGKGFQLGERSYYSDEHTKHFYILSVGL